MDCFENCYFSLYKTSETQIQETSCSTKKWSCFKTATQEKEWKRPGKRKRETKGRPNGNYRSESNSEYESKTICGGINGGGERGEYILKMNFFYLKRVATTMVNLLIRNRRQMRREKFVISAKGKC